MQTYIVFDLEWNQCATGRGESVPGLPFEIIEIGAVKLDGNFSKISTFRRIIRPVVYEKIHFRVLEVVNLGIRELRRSGSTFGDACREFFEWCYAEGERPIFCTWGDMDLPQLQRNMTYFGIENPLPYPLLYYDIQKLYTMHTEGHHKTMAPLDKAVEDLDIIDDGGFHSAVNDALYTAQVMQRIDMHSLRPYMSLDYYRIPENDGEEIYLVFPDYSKYVSRAYDSKEECFAEKKTKDVLCYRCNRMLKKTVGWFSSNQKLYHCIAWCPEHGYLKGKMRIRHTDDGKIYAVKTIKMVNETKAAAVSQYRDEVKSRKKK